MEPGRERGFSSLTRSLSAAVNESRVHISALNDSRRVFFLAVLIYTARKLVAATIFGVQIKRGAISQRVNPFCLRGASHFGQAGLFFFFFSYLTLLESLFLPFLFSPVIESGSFDRIRSYVSLIHSRPLTLRTEFFLYWPVCCILLHQ